MHKVRHETCCGFFSVLGNRARMAIIEELDKGDKNVSHLCKALGLEQSLVSHALRRLVRCQFVSVKRKGKERVYSLNKKTVKPALAIAREHEKHCVHAKKCCDK